MLPIRVATSSTWRSSTMALPLPDRGMGGWSGRREAPGPCGFVSPTGLVSSRRHLEPCMRFSRTRLSDVLHRRHSAIPSRPGGAWARRQFPRA